MVSLLGSVCCDRLPGVTPSRNASTRRSAGLLPYRAGGGLEVFLGHMGGPLWARRQAGAWTLVKGEYDPQEDPLDAARREWAEETGLAVPGGRWVDLGEVRQSGGKRVRAWAVGADRASGADEDLDLAAARSGTFTLQWPPRSGRQQEFPELDRFAWWTPDAAMKQVVSGQVPLLKRLVAALS
jgi:predicted NUDIX family NTP pyrophosphohydrolase